MLDPTLESLLVFSPENLTVKHNVIITFIQKRSGLIA